MTDIWDKKLKALLHDSLDKPFILMIPGISHDNRAKEIAQDLGVDHEKVLADHISSAMERSFLPKGSSLQVKFLENPWVIHPLSGKGYEKISTLKNKSHEIFYNALNEAVRDITKNLSDDEKKKFLSLWRNLLPLAMNKTQDNLGKFWVIAPADTRIPDHSIFEHLKITSACVNTSNPLAFVYHDAFANSPPETKKQWLKKEEYEKYTAEKVEEIDVNNIGLLRSKIDGIYKHRISLFLFSLGPVQDFISSSRKTQDLYWSSYILSYLTWKAIEKIIDKFGPDSIIFPDLHGQPLCDLWLQEQDVNPVNFVPQYLKTPTIPNRFLAILPINKIEDLPDLDIKSELRKISENILKELEIEKPDGFDNQINTFLETYLVMVPFTPTEEGRADWENQLDILSRYTTQTRIEQTRQLLEWAKNNAEYPPNIGNLYGLLYEFIQRIHLSRKNIRNFQQLSEQGRKCSLCGERNVLFFYETKNKNKFKQFNPKALDLTDNQKISAKFLSDGEGLCAICFTKRCAELYFKQELGKGIEFDFPSTADICLLNILTYKNKELQDLLKDYKQMFGDKFDAELLFKENLTERYFEKNGLDKNILKKNPQEKLKKIDKLCEELNLPKHSYYAVIKMDGDNMGKWLSGELAPDFNQIYHPTVWKNLPENFREGLENKKRPLTPALHAVISTALKNFSLKLVPKIIDDSKGKIIYCGGDDLLVFANLSYLLDIMVELRARFSGHINKNLEVDFTDKPSGFVDMGDELLTLMGHRATASMGVIIAHYKHPLRDVLFKVSEMLEFAKEEEGKDAFAIAVLKHSGEIQQARVKWYYDGTGKEGTIGILKCLLGIIQNKICSTKFIFTLAKEIGLLKAGQVKNILQTELRRLITRSCMKKEEKNKVDALAQKINTLFEKIPEKKIEDFLNLMQIIAFISKR